MGKKRKQTHEFDDQFGGQPQDREDNVGLPAKGGGTGGGTAGKSRNGPSLNFQRHVPKFLQPFAHMLSRPAEDEDEPQVIAGERQRAALASAADDDEDEERAAQEEAIQRALEENPELAAQLGGDYQTKFEASKEKELGNKAFAAKDYERAIQHFTKCIELDATNAVFFSNRSAAAANLGRYDEALRDAQRVLKLKPGWVKGHARAAAAYMGLQLFSEAKEAYEAAVKLEPDDQTLRQGLDKATALELQHMRERKHVFKKQQQPKRPKGDDAAAAGSKPKQRAKLSFAADEDDEA